VSDHQVKIKHCNLASLAFPFLSPFFNIFGSKLSFQDFEFLDDIFPVMDSILSFFPSPPFFFFFSLLFFFLFFFPLQRDGGKVRVSQGCSLFIGGRYTNIQNPSLLFRFFPSPLLFPPLFFSFFSSSISNQCIVLGRRTDQIFFFFFPFSCGFFVFFFFFSWQSLV